MQPHQMAQTVTGLETMVDRINNRKSVAKLAPQGPLINQIKSTDTKRQTRALTPPSMAHTRTQYVSPMNVPPPANVTQILHAPAPGMGIVYVDPRTGMPMQYMGMPLQNTMIPHPKNPSPHNGTDDDDDDKPLAKKTPTKPQLVQTLQQPRPTALGRNTAPAY